MPHGHLVGEHLPDAAAFVSYIIDNAIFLASSTSLDG
jgi:hypothetical protein